MASVAPLKPVALDTPSPETATYMEQLFAIEGGQAYDSSVWPSEAVDADQRAQTLTQYVAGFVCSGPHFNATSPLSNAQVLWAMEQANANPHWNLNPVILRALERAAEVAGRHPAEAPLPWAHHGETQPVRLIPTGSYGTTPASGYYGTGHGTLK